MSWAALLMWIGPKLWPWLAPRLVASLWVAGGVVAACVAIWAYILGESK